MLGRSPCVAFAFVCAAVTLALLGPASPVAAHTELDFTLPAHGAAVGEPVSEVRVGFTEPVTLVGPGFTALTAQGEVLNPFAVTDDDVVFRLQFDPPLYGGAVNIRYEVAAADGHVLDGSFAFTVAVDALPTTAPVPSAATVATDLATAATEPEPAPVPVSALIARAPVGTLSTVAPSSVAPAPSTTADGTGGGGGTGTTVVVIVAIAAAGAGFVFVRTRHQPD